MLPLRKHPAATTAVTNDSAASLLDDHAYAALERRVGRLHLKRRLGIERDREARIFGQGINFFHIENWYSVHALIRHTLRLAALHGRGRRNARHIEVRHNDIVIPTLPEAFHGYTVLHISDLHLDMSPDIPAVLAARVRELDYDICVLTGDFRAKTYGPYEAALEGLARVRVHMKDEVYAILGNHDTLRMVPGMEALGVRLLLNESVALTRGNATLHLAGIDDPHYYQADNIEKAAEHIPHDALSILLSHSPEMYQHAAHAGFNVMLCGHTHAGQICLPGGRALLRNARCPRRYCAGAWRYHDMIGYTSAGSGVSIVDVRLNCPAEVTLHRLRRP